MVAIDIQSAQAQYGDPARQPREWTMSGNSRSDHASVGAEHAFVAAQNELPTRDLVAPPTTFIGRQREVSVIVELLNRTDLRLLTLTGSGGIGKTRLAQRVADSMRDSFSDGVAFVSLAAVRDVNAVLPAIAHALKVPDNRGQPLMSRIHTFLATKTLLLVLDNYEHLLVTAPMVLDLLAMDPNLTVLCTSRVRLNISGEHLFDVPPLNVTPEEGGAGIDRIRECEAVQLFVQRASASSPAFLLTPGNATDVMELCRRLDGLPLGIELAAARIQMFPPAELLSRLGRILDLLTGGPQDAPPRLRAMREAIAWSYDLLTPAERTLFRKLAVFAGGFTTEAAEAVIGNEVMTLDGLSSLVAASLVKVVIAEPDGTVRFSMLETIRAYALERLASVGEEPAMLRSHAEYCVFLAEQPWGGDRSEIEDLLQQLRPEIENLRAAISWTIKHEPADALRITGELDEYWMRYGHVTEARNWIERALVAENGPPSHYRTRAKFVAGRLALEQEDLPHAEDFLNQALREYLDLEDGCMIAFSLILLGNLAMRAGDLERANDLLVQAHQRADLCGDPDAKAITRLDLGRLALATGDLARAEALLNESHALHRLNGWQIGEAFPRLFLGQESIAQGDMPAAATHFGKAIRAFADVGDSPNLARSLEGFAGAIMGRTPETAAALLGVAAAIRNRASQPRPKEDDQFFDKTMATACKAMEQPTFKSAWEEGRTWSMRTTLDKVEAVEAVLAISPDQPDHPAAWSDLTPRETEVLRLLIEGQSNRTIADALSLSERTVENHVVHILSKLELESRTAAATYALRHGFL
jgi:non-specific serine/threonine protein kinase